MSLMAVGPSTVQVSALAVSIYGLTLGLLELVAVGFGLLWTALNFYQYFPIAQASVEHVYDRFFGGAVDQVAIDDADLPSVDVLLPAYQEGSVIEQSIRSVRTADYPQDRLHLYVIVEPGDAETRTVLQELKQYRFTEVVVPETYPGDPNKPRALNYAFEHTDSEIIGIVDAEDIVEPNLFREAAHQIAAGRDFVQGRLDMVNESDGWLNTVFRAEYGFWYEIVMPAFQRVGFPLPLSGTSCLFRRSLLIVANVERQAEYGAGFPRDGHLWTGSRRLFGWTPWDPTNVTEDFELGLFLWQHGFDVGYLESTTAEESPLSVNAWMKQRTRWNKGKIQTFLKYLRTPPTGFREKAHLYWQSFLPHLGPLNLAGAVLLVVMANLARYEPRPLVAAVLSLSLAFVVISISLFGVGYWLASDAPRGVRIRRLATLTLTVPIYWLLQWAADIRAIEQTHRGWFGWERVAHHGRNFSRGGHAHQDTRPSTALPSTVRHAGLAGIVVVGAILRLVHIDRMSLWIDEIYSIAIRGTMPVPDLLVVPNDPHPPLYYLLLQGWMSVFGATATSARLFSALISIATIPALYLLGKELFDDRVGLIAAGLLALSTYHIHFGRTARMYALVGLFTVGSWFFFTRLRFETPVDLAGYLLASTALIYTHAFGLLVILAQYGFVALSETRGGISPRRWLKAQAGLVVLAGPLIAFVIWRLVGGLLSPSYSAPIDWIPIPSTIAVTQTVLSYLGYPAHYPVLAESTGLWLLASVLLLLALGAVGLSVVSYRPDEGYRLEASWRTGQLALLLVVPVVVPFVASYVFAPMYAPRYTLPASFGLYLLIAAGIMNVPGRRARRVVLLVFLVCTAPLVGAYFAAGSVEDWQAAGEALSDEASPGDLLIFQPGWIDTYLEYYYDGPPLERVALERGGPTSSEREALAGRVAGHSRVWVVAYRGAPSVSLESLLSDRERSVLYEDDVLSVYRYERTADTGGQQSA